jgi:DNA-binding CsgD family transcriptional regulator
MLHIVAENSRALTAREREVVGWMAEGKTCAETAAILETSPRTVETQMRAAMAKLGVFNRGALIYEAVRRGVLPCPCPACVADKAVAA